MSQGQVVKLPYLICSLPDHTDEHLNLVCIEPGCKQQGLICTLCREEHQNHCIMPLKYLLNGLKTTLSTNQNEEECCAKLEELEACKQSMLFQLKQCVEQLAQKFMELEQSIIDSHNKVKLQIIEQIQLNMRIQNLMANAVQGPVVPQQFKEEIAKVAQWVHKEGQQLKLELDLDRISMPFIEQQKDMSRIVKETEFFGKSSLLLIEPKKVPEKPKNNTKEPLTYSYSFSQAFKAKSITLSNNNKRALQSSTNPARFVLIEAGMGIKNKKIVFQVPALKNWVGIGVCVKSKIVSTNYNFKYENLGHGSYLLSNNGYSWSHSDKAQNVHSCGVTFKEKNQVEVTLSPDKLHFLVRETGTTFSMKVDFSEEDWSTVCFCANLCSVGDEIEILDA